MITKDFSIETDLLTFNFAEGKGERFYLKEAPGKVEVICPRNADFSKIQPWLFKVLENLLRKQAKSYLPPRLHALSVAHGFSYRDAKITSAHTRWGSCSSLGNINMSLYLMILPGKLVDYVLLHELCHTKEMNHGPNFWALMDKVTDGKAKELRNELKRYPSPFIQD